MNKRWNPRIAFWNCVGAGAIQFPGIIHNFPDSPLLLAIGIATATFCFLTAWDIAKTYHRMRRLFERNDIPFPPPQQE